eukprot:g8248.t1
MEFTPLFENACCLAVGIVLKQTRLLDAIDEKVRHPRLTVCGVGVVYSLACHALSWQLYGRRHPRERAVLTGCSVGSSLLLWSFPFAESVFGVFGMQVVVLFGLANIFAEHLLSYLNFASAGPANPESYTHQDGGIYRGQWNGLKKHGVGTYKYTSGAIYEGEWKENAKTGRGVYYFKKASEWLDGKRNGIGIRTFSDGTFKAGQWLNNDLVSSLEIWQCQDAVLGATQAAKAARQVKVGGGKLFDAIHEIIVQPITWATAAALCINFVGAHLSPTVEIVSKTLAAVHRPLALILAGFSISLIDVDAIQIQQAAEVVAQRLILALVLSSAALFGSYRLFPELVPFLLPVMLITLAPAPSNVITTVQQFQLNIKLATTVVRVSSVASLVLMLGLSFLLIVAQGKTIPLSNLVPYLAKFGIAAATAVCLMTLVLRLVYGPMRTRKMTLTRLEYPSASELDTDGLESVLQSTQAPKEQAQPPLNMETKREDITTSDTEDSASDAFQSFFSDRDKGGESPPNLAALKWSQCRAPIKRTFIPNKIHFRRSMNARPLRLQIWRQSDMPRIKCRRF